MELADGELTERIIAGAYRVQNTLGAGLLERVYENAMASELERRMLAFRRQVPLRVSYLGQSVGDFLADMLVEDCVICEFKATERLTTDHEVHMKCNW